MKTVQKTALVTGASKGIGAAIALRLAQDGYNILLNYRSDEAAAAKVAAAIRAEGRDCRVLQFDVTDDVDLGTKLEPILEDTTLSVLVNNAGFSRDTLMFWMSHEEWQDVLDVHLTGFYNVTRRVIESMVRQKAGRIINIVSTSGQTGMAGQVNYCAAKAGLIGATKALARELARKNVLVNAVSPGFIATAMTEELPTVEILPRIPLGRLGKCEDVAGAVAFLCSDGAAYITGQVLNVNGGIHM